jgi:hypothetical protein
VNRAALLAGNEVETEDELGHPAENGHRHAQLEDLGVGEVSRQIGMHLLAHVSVRVRQIHLFGEPQDRAILRRKHAAFHVLKESIDLFFGQACPSRRDGIDLVSEEAAVRLRELESE